MLDPLFILFKIIKVIEYEMTTSGGLFILYYVSPPLSTQLSLQSFHFYADRQYGSK